MDRFPLLLLCRGVCYTTAGQTVEARQILEELKTSGRITYVPPFAKAATHFPLQEPDQGLEWMDKAGEERDLMAVLDLKSAICG